MKVFKNIATNFLIFLINIIIGLFLPPYIIDKMGVEAYGLIPLANSISTYALIIAIAINGTIARYLILDVTKKDFLNANKTFNTAFWGLTCILLALFPVLLYVSFTIENYINVPKEILNESHFLFFLIFISFIISTYTSLLNSSPYINNRLDLINFTNLIRSLAKIGGIILLFHYISVTLQNFAYATLLASVLALVVSYIIFKRQTPFLTLKIKFFDRKVLKDILSMGGWLLVSQIGALLFLQIDLIVINVVSGAEAAGMYSVLLPWNALIRTFAAVIAGVVAPIQLKYYASNKINEILKITNLSVKYLGVLISLIVGVLCVFSERILFLWLGNDFVELQWLFIVLISHLGVNLSVLPLYPVTNAYKKVKLPGIVTVALGLLNASLAYVFLKYTSLELYGVALASFIVLTLKNLAFAAPYTAHILGLKKVYFLKSMIPAVLVFIAVFLVGYGLTSFCSITSWFELILAAAALSFLALLIIFITIVNKSERSIIITYLKERFKKVKFGHV